MLTLTEIPDVTFCGCRIFLGVDNNDLTATATKDAAEIFKDAYRNSILDRSRITQRAEQIRSEDPDGL